MGYGGNGKTKLVVELRREGKSVDEIAEILGSQRAYIQYVLRVKGECNRDQVSYPRWTRLIIKAQGLPLPYAMKLIENESGYCFTKETWESVLRRKWVRNEVD